MKKSLQLSILCILIAFLASCKSSGPTSSLINKISQSEITFPSNILPVEKADTIYTKNAPNRITRKIRRDNESNLLIAAYEDIIRYDGQSFVILPKENGLESFDAFDALEDIKGNIWIASTHLGIFKIDGPTTIHFTSDEGLVHNRYMCVEEDSFGNIWMGSEGGISVFNGKTLSTLTEADGLTHNEINTIMEDEKGNIWIGTRESACIYDRSTSTFSEITNNEGEPFENIWSIIEDKQGNVWLSGNQGIWQFDGSTFSLVTKIKGICLFEDTQGNVWITHQANDPHKGRLSFLDKDSLRNRPAKAKEIFTGDGMFFGIAEDIKGDIWVGTLQGVFRYDGKSIIYYRDEKLKR